MHRPSQLILALLLAGAVSAAGAADRASAELIDRSGKTTGSITLTEAPTGILIQVSAKGLAPGAKGIHIHSVGTCEDPDKGFVASKGHLNPTGKKHGLMNPEGPDSGDLPVIFVHADGSVEAEMFTSLASLRGAGDRPALLDADGAAIVIHENRDDHVTQPIGGAGARIACGVVKAE
ncbi:superoxide dismutase [Parazoarcus communis]|uniref:Superoxide dismutase [Cu-Zn] n=1 Tax=Parazoarcus communis TaxID=41977 RepID=A0A2U8GM94_9RHOO|nr:superoxide dismutase family protein [Parazoarcus communis]AWI74086.1 superoxide dismutase [Parazoarcus communis]|tara:strand:+ start:35456 stop:35986 length:531 start_codon:yes stop_codon:yes gene_type:complete